MADRRSNIARCVLLLACAGACADAWAVCGDAVRTGAEQCDDGNSVPSDGCDATCRFEQTHRINSLTQRFTTTAGCPQNALGAAFSGALFQSQLNAQYATAVENGAISILFTIRGLDDLSGNADAAVDVGVLNGSPEAGAPYDGNDDLDWWYGVPVGDLDAQGVAPTPLAGSIAASTLDAGPGRARLRIFGAGNTSWTASSVFIDATIGDSSTPLASSGQPPGHLASEHLDPALQSFATTSGGSLCANIEAASLAATPVPASLTGGGVGACSQGYVVGTNSLLDVIVGGCTIFGQPQVTPRQPDTVDPAAPAAGNGPPYAFVANPSRVVTGCFAQGQAAPLADCLKAAAYSSQFQFTTDRVIVRVPLFLFGDGFEGEPPP